MLQAILVRLFFSKKRKSTATSVPQREVPMSSSNRISTPETTSDSAKDDATPSYATLNEAVDAACTGHFASSRRLLRQAESSLEKFPEIRAVLLAGASFVNAADQNYGLAGEQVTDALRQLQLNGHKLNKETYNYVQTMCFNTIRLVPLGKLAHGASVERKYLEAVAHEDRQEYAPALALLLEIEEVIGHEPQLRMHPTISRRVADTTTRICRQLERQDAQTRLKTLVIATERSAASI